MSFGGFPSALGWSVFTRTYARRIRDDDPTSVVETWEQCVDRVVRACNEQLGCGFSPEEAASLAQKMLDLKCCVAGRFLWQLGTAAVRKTGLMSLQNCAFVVVDEPVRPFTWAMNFLMLGAGVGYRILPSDLANISPPVKHATITRQDTNDADFIVPDSREGWVQLLAKTLKCHFYGKEGPRGRGFTYSCVCLRSKGAAIKSFGGLASGPDLLCDGITKISAVLNARAGLPLRPIDALDIMNIIGMVVISGNVRRYDCAAAA